jgi:RNA polymerase sigma-70 factor (ECF subfamily)
VNDRDVEATLARALAGDPGATRALLGRFAPILQSRAIRVLVRRRRAGADVRQEMMDMVQEVFLSLLEDDGRVLRSWKPDRGLSLDNFVGLVAERQICSILRNGKRSPWTEEPTADDRLERHAGASTAEEEASISRDLLESVFDRLREELSPRMLELFYAFWVDETPVPEICARMNMQQEAVWAARSRIARRARAIAEELAQDASGRGGVAAKTGSGP